MSDEPKPRKSMRGDPGHVYRGAMKLDAQLGAMLDYQRSMRRVIADLVPIAVKHDPAEAFHAMREAMSE